MLLCLVKGETSLLLHYRFGLELSLEIRGAIDRLLLLGLGHENRRLRLILECWPNLRLLGHDVVLILLNSYLSLLGG